MNNRWRSRPVLGALLTTVALAVPFFVSVAVAVTVGDVLGAGGGPAGHAAWWAAVLASSTLAFVLCERAARRLLPLAALLKMTMLFPDQAPKRLKVAWRAGLTRQLELTTTQEGGPKPVPSVVAEEILALAASLSRHDRLTRGHSERVRALTDLIAAEMHLSPADRDRLRWSALLHDVGKLTVHPDVLNKAGKPSEEEWEQIRDHPLQGRRLIAPLASWLGPWALAVEQHHENYDGSGYPFGLARDELSLAARIVSVADAFEVMTSNRSYSKAMTAAAARKELTRCAGSQFDPAIVRTFLNISVGRLRWTMGPLSWLADTPVLVRLGTAGRTLAAGAQVAAGATAVGVGGVLAAHAALTPAARPEGRHSAPVLAQASGQAPATTTTGTAALSGPLTSPTATPASHPHTQAEPRRTTSSTGGTPATTTALAPGEAPVPVSIGPGATARTRPTVPPPATATGPGPAPPVSSTGPPTPPARTTTSPPTTAPEAEVNTSPATTTRRPATTTVPEAPSTVPQPPLSTTSSRPVPAPTGVTPAQSPPSTGAARTSSTRAQPPGPAPPPPAATTTRPATTTTRPATTTTRPVTTTTRPVTTTTALLTTTTRRPVTTTTHPATTHPAITTTTRATPATSTKSSTTTSRPPTTTTAATTTTVASTTTSVTTTSSQQTTTSPAPTTTTVGIPTTTAPVPTTTATTGPPTSTSVPKLCLLVCLPL